MENGAFAHAMRSSTQSEIAALAHQASLKGSEGPALVVFSGGTAFNSVAGGPQNPSRRTFYLICMQDMTFSSFNGDQILPMLFHAVDAKRDKKRLSSC